QVHNRLFEKNKTETISIPAKPGPRVELGSAHRNGACDLLGKSADYQQENGDRPPVIPPENRRRTGGQPPVNAHRNRRGNRRRTACYLTSTSSIASLLGPSIIAARVGPSG